MTFRNNKPISSADDGKSFTGRTIALHSPSAILVGLALHASVPMAKNLKPAAFKRMDPVAALALQCDLTGSDAEIKARMKEAGLTSDEVEALWAVTDQSFKAARKREIDKRIQMKPADADREAFSMAQAKLVGFLKDADSNEEESKESFR